MANCRPSPLAWTLAFSALGLAASASAPARASCVLALSQGTFDMGQKVSSALPLADSPRFRVMGTAMPTLTGVCTEQQTHIRIAIDGITPAEDGGIEWRSSSGGQPGLARLSITQASVGGVPVSMAVSTQPGALLASVERLGRDSVIELDLSRLPPDRNRKTFTLGLRLQALVPAAYSPRSSATFEVSPAFSMRD